ncbi:MAG: DUF455 family protein [Planctomycetes bacterium]|nr:DUF455 family protein [Planctomycetota bacterium]
MRARARKRRRARRARAAEARARLLHTFAHHELQAAELFAWALLAFPDAPEAFRRGLVRLCLDELRHLNLLVARLVALGSRFGAYPVRDWFWERFPSCATPLEFVALMGLGLEGANLDHAERWARHLADAGDGESAAVQRLIGVEEQEHVRFAVQWFRAWTGGLDFARWRASLPAPLTPLVLRGPELARAARCAAGFDEAFVEELEAWRASASGT